MGTYYMIANLDKRETLQSPTAAKEFEWNHPRNPSASVVTWALFHRWNGDRVEVVNDAGAYDEHPAYRDGWPNVWKQVEVDYVRAIEGRGWQLSDKAAHCTHGFAWFAVTHCPECFPEVDPAVEP